MGQDTGPNLEDESEVAGYVDSGMWALEEWLRNYDVNRQAGLKRLMLHMGLLEIDED